MMGPFLAPTEAPPCWGERIRREGAKGWSRWIFFRISLLPGGDELLGQRIGNGLRRKEEEASRASFQRGLGAVRQNSISRRMPPPIERRICGQESSGKGKEPPSTCTGDFLCFLTTGGKRYRKLIR